MGENGKQAAEDRKPTQRVVLRQERVLVISDEVTDEQIGEAVKALGGRTGRKAVSVPVAWVECGEFTGSKKGAIEAYAGKAGTPDAKVGTFKAPTVTAMKGGIKHSAPPLPLVQSEAID